MESRGAPGKMRGFFAPLRMTPSVLMTPSYLMPLAFSLGCFRTVGFVDGLLLWGDVFDDDAADATAVHLGDLVAPAFVLHAFPDGGDVAEMREKEACQSFDADFAGEGPVELVAEVAKWRAAVEDHGSSGAEEG